MSRWLAHETKELLRRNNLRPKKRLGQHFLISSRAVEEILNALELTREDVVLEIGSGLGLLARAGGPRVKQWVGVERDARLVEVSRQVCAGIPWVSFVEDDILEVDIVKLGLADRRVKIIGNLPYVITSPVLERLVRWHGGAVLFIERAVLLLQREVAQRLSAMPGSKTYGSLSVNIQLWAEVKLLSIVGRGGFLPPPNVMSALVMLRFFQESVVERGVLESMEKIVRTAFRQRRKMLRQSLKPCGVREGQVVEWCVAAGVDPTRRAETLTLEEFAGLARASGCQDVEKVKASGIQ